MDKTAQRSTPADRYWRPNPRVRSRITASRRSASFVKEYQKAANTFRLALDGDLDPKWVKVWSWVSLGKIFDVVGARDRAVHFYQLAIGTRDNTRGAVDEASRYLEIPFAQE
jgi:hypothetical protein